MFVVEVYLIWWSPNSLPSNRLRNVKERYLKCTSDVLKDVINLAIHVKHKHDIGFHHWALFSCFLVFRKLVKWITPTEEILFPVLSTNNYITSFDDLWESGMKSRKYERKGKAFRILTYFQNVLCKRSGYQNFSHDL